MTKNASSNPWVLRDRLSGSLTGLLVGDALGVPYEFKLPDELPSADQFEFEPPAGFMRSHPGVPPGTWSDDGAQALVLLDSLVNCHVVDLDHFAGGLVRWATQGFCAVDGNVFDIGSQTARAIARLAAGCSPECAGPDDEHDNGNGSLMRVLPLALWHQGTDANLAFEAALQSKPTHGHKRAWVACAQYCLWIRAILQESPNPWEAATARLRTIATEDKTNILPLDEVDFVLHPGNAAGISGTGYVVDTLWSARAAFEASTNFEDCMRRGIALGHDTDTVAAVAGGVAGAHYGFAGIPARWREGLRGQDILRPLLHSLLEQCVPSRQASSMARTSLTNPMRIAELSALAGRIGITFCPGKKQKGAISGTWDRDLDIDLAAIRAWGATNLVTLIEGHEFVELQVESLPERAATHGLHWHHLPIVDTQAPDAAFEVLWGQVFPILEAALRRGEGVVVHCKGGLGRAGTIAARLLAAIRPELSMEDAMKMVRNARPGAVETRVQEQYLLGVGRK